MAQQKVNDPKTLSHADIRVPTSGFSIANSRFARRFGRAFLHHHLPTGMNVSTQADDDGVIVGA